MDLLLWTLEWLCNIFAVLTLVQFYLLKRIAGKHWGGGLFYSGAVLLAALLFLEYTLNVRIADWQTALQLFGSQMHKP